MKPHDFDEFVNNNRARVVRFRHADDEETEVAIDDAAGSPSAVGSGA